jgi:hypothetical protein
VTLTLRRGRPDDSAHDNFNRAASPDRTHPAARSAARQATPLPKIAIAFLAIIVLFGGGAGAFANASLSSTYSPGRAVTDYLAAMSRDDVTYMLANGNNPRRVVAPTTSMVPSHSTR